MASSFDDFMYGLLNSGQQRHPGVGGGMPATVNPLASAIQSAPAAPSPAPAQNQTTRPASMGYQMPERAPQGNSGGNGGGFLSGLGNVVQNFFAPQARGRNITIDWLQKQGMDEGMATLLAGNKPMLQKYLIDRTRGRQPDYDFMNVGGTLVRTDNFGNAVPLGHFGQDEPAARPMTPTERLKWGIPQSDKRPYAMTENGPKLIGGTGVTVNTSYSGEKGYDKTVGEGYGKRFLGMQDAANTARRTLTGLDVMEQAMSDPNFYSGSGEGYINGLKRLGASIGINPDSVSSVETFNAMSKQAALDNMGGSLGTGFSNADRDFVVDQVPKLGNTPAGNQKLIGILRKIAERKQKAAGLARQYAASHGGRIDAGFDTYLANWAKANPLFPEAQNARERRYLDEQYRQGSGPGMVNSSRTTTGVQWSIGQ